MTEPTENALRTDFFPSAIKEVALSREQKDAENLARLIKPLQSAVESLSQITGIDTSFSYFILSEQSDPMLSEKSNHLFIGELAVGNSRTMINDGVTGYVIGKLPKPKYNAPLEEYEGVGKTLKDVLQSIAMIAKLNYPDKKAEIDTVINEAIGKNQGPAPVRQSPKHGVPS